MAGNIRRNRNNELLAELAALQRALALQAVSGSGASGPPGPQGDPGEDFQGSLTAESILSAVPPGGELGGTWVEPTVDAVHSGSAHPTANEQTWLTNGLAGQVAFPATQSASSGANVLDDYEEGAWTPGLTFGGNSVGIAYVTQSGNYVKIGRQVFVGCLLYLSAKGSSTGATLLTGLPFAMAASTYSVGVLGISTAITFDSYPWARINEGQAYLSLYETSTVGAATELTDADFANNSTLYLSYSYLVAV